MRDFSTDSMSEYSYWQIQNWMQAMANSYPPPPPPDQNHYNALYPTSAGAQQSYDSAQQDQLQYASLNTPAFPKVETSSPAQSGSTQLQSLANELSQHAALEDQQRQQIQHAAQQAQHQPGVHAPVAINNNFPPGSQEQSSDPKSNRLRKACDSCSVRKVKVR